MIQENRIKRIAVIGPGMMGHAIAQEFAVAGYDVTLCGRNEKRLEKAYVRIEESLNELAQWELISTADVKPALDQLTMTTDLEAAGAQADLIVESIVEVLEAKKDLFSKLDAVCPKHTIFASNTSSLMPSMLAAATQRKDRFLVAHYFNPPYLMPLVEIVRGRDTSDEIVNVIYVLYEKMGKSPIICQKEAPGFILYSIHCGSRHISSNVKSSLALVFPRQFLISSKIPSPHGGPFAFII